MAKFEFREVFRLPLRKEFVITGVVIEGEIKEGMVVAIWIDSKLYWHIPVKHIEFVDRVAQNESLVGLVCEELNTEDASLFSDFCSIGDVIEVKYDEE
jgi:hypothetical protein